MISLSSQLHHLNINYPFISLIRIIFLLVVNLSKHPLIRSNIHPILLHSLRLWVHNKQIDVHLLLVLSKLYVWWLLIKEAYKKRMITNYSEDFLKVINFCYFQFISDYNGEDHHFTTVGPGGLINLEKIYRTQAVMDHISSCHQHYHSRNRLSPNSNLIEYLKWVLI